MICRSDWTAIGERPALIRNLAKWSSVSRSSSLSVADGSTRDQVGVGGGIGRRVSIDSSYRRFVPLTGEGFARSARGFDATALEVALDPSVVGVFGAPSNFAIDVFPVVWRGSGERSGGPSWEGCWSAMLSGLEHPATNNRMRVR